MTETKLKFHEMNLKKLNNYVAVTLATLYYLCTDGQTQPDGRRCTICGDIGHQAFECQFNAFKLFKRIASKLNEFPKEVHKL